MSEKGLSEKASLHDNLVIHGDNLAALKSLLPTYHGRVKYVYIDPPYNTGNEGWAYNDIVTRPLMRNWLGHVVGPRRPDPPRQVVLHDDAAPQAPRAGPRLTCSGPPACRPGAPNSGQGGLPSLRRPPSPGFWRNGRFKAPMWPVPATRIMPSGDRSPSVFGDRVERVRQVRPRP